MKQLRIALVLSTFLFLILSSCSNNMPNKIPSVTATFTASPNNVPPQDVQLKANVSAVVNQDTGPGGLSQQGLPPIAKCTAPMPLIGTVTTFCANQTTKTGGATIGLISTAWHDGNCYGEGSNSNPKLVCSGPENSTVHLNACGICGGGEDNAGSAVFGNYTCAKGTAKTAAGACNQASAEGGYYPCPAGSHYDNDQQYCLDDVTNQKLADLCPPGTVTYLPDYHYCLTKPFPERYNCQTFTVTLGDCFVRSSHSSGGCQAPALGCTRGKHWDGTSCSCK